MRKSLHKAILLFVLSSLFLSQSHAFAKKAENSGLGPSILLIGTFAAQKIDAILKDVKTLGRQVENLSKDELNFLFGYTNYRLKKLKQANSFLEKSDISLVRDYILYYRAQIALENKDYELSRNLFEKLLKNHPDSVWINEARLGEGEALLHLGRFEEAQASLEYYLKSQPTAEGGFRARILKTRIYLESGSIGKAVGELKDMTLKVSDENELNGIIELAETADRKFGSNIVGWIASPQTQHEIAGSFISRSQWEDAMRHLEKLLKSNSIDEDLHFRLKWFYARCHFRAHYYDKAIPLIEELIETDHRGKMRLVLLQHLASAYARVDNYDRSIELRNQIITEYPHVPSVVSDSLYKIAFLLVDEGRYEDAIPIWERLSKRSGVDRAKAAWYLAWSHYKLKQYEESVRCFDELTRRGGRSEDRSAYWKARSLENLGKKEDARQIFDGIASGSQNGYYSVLARRRLGGGEKRTANSAEKGKKIKSRWSANIPNPEEINTTHLARAVEFDKLNLHEEVAMELSYAVKEKELLNSDLLLWLAGKNFADNIASNIVYQKYPHILRSFPSSGGFERFVWEKFYPEAYKPLVERLVGVGFDRRIVYAIMRSESNFRTKVVSPAGAIGLMQLMPATARKMAGDKETFKVEDLYHPTKNIELGILYLKKLFGLFPNNIAAVIASYNAGEEAVSKWLTHGYSSDPEEFIEEIPYDETNMYVKKVLAAYWILQRLYPL